MFRLALAVLLMSAQAPQTAQAAELSPWFGSEDAAAFQLGLTPMDLQEGSPVSVTMPTEECNGICSNPPKFAIMGAQDLAEAP